ncbi:ligand-binding sensor domain-containing diguanylate cyclase [Rhodanobacter sp. L36]|uniref:ligand-binding sensor domain-containing diguanylate cyclase n=1 Tax=Rhodanobacter sp. L36 TaxID=1747221 RepID=UPI00131C3214|nr:ligand-binding sensor domain-containing diguanylate cyclase [Rhodanobacter sp. L36]
MWCKERGLLALFAALLLWMSLPAKAQQYSLQTYDRRAGLESLTVTALLQDRRGFVWAGTEIGLYRFDGGRFERMEHTQGFDKGEYVTALAQNPRIGRLWVATQSGLRVGDGLHFDSVLPDGKPLVVDVGRQMAALDDGTLLLVRDDQLMVLSAGVNGSPHLQPRFSAQQLARYPALRSITSVYASHDRVWLGCGTSLCEIDASGNIALLGPARGVPADNWSGMLVDHRGTLWLRGVHHVRALPAGATQFVERDVPQTSMDVVNDNGTLIEDAQGRVLTSTNDGLARWDGASWTTMDRHNGLPDIGITALLFDTQGTLWLGTYGRGISRWNGYGLVEGWAREQGFDSVPNWSILRVDASHMWFGNELGGSTLADGQTRLQTWPLQTTPPPRQVLALAKASDGAIWAGLYDHRVLRYDPRTGRTALAAQLPAFVKVLHFDKRGRLWIGTVDGIYRIDSTGAAAVRMPPAQTTDQQCSDIAEGDDGTLWFACNEGVLRYAGEHWTHMETGHVIVASGFSAVAVGSDAGLWLGANEPGIFRARVHDDELVIAHVADTWLDKSLAYFIRRDHRGLIWIGGGGGVDIFDGNAWTHMSRDEGLLWDETDQNSFYEDADGSVWIGSAIGVSHVLRPEAMIAPNPRKVVVTSVTHGDVPVREGDDVRIEGHRAPLTVHFALLGSSSGGTPTYRYRLQGSDWVETSSSVINLTGLSPDEYRLEIQAIDDDRRVRSPPSYFDFRIPSPWWRSAWATLLEVLLLILAVAAIWRGYSRRLLRQNRRLETMVNGRTAELTEEKQALEIARTRLYYQATHDGLTGLYNRSAILDELAAQLEPAPAQPGLAVALIDADHFKRINDTYGHQAGDAALLSIARHLQSHVRNDDRLGRYGGEEILMLLPGINKVDAEQRMRGIQAQVSAVPHVWEGKKFTVTLSIGLVWIGNEAATVEELIRRADAALYLAKHSGRDRVVAERLAS